jgi:O-antigen/teichoic acid export membrane protein
MLDAGDDIVQPTKAITKSLSLAVLYKLAQYPFLLLFVVFVPRLMGPEFYGQYALLISIVVITTSLIDLGLTEICGRFIPELSVSGERQLLVKFSSQILSLKIVISCLTSLVLFAIVYWAYSDRFPLPLLVIVSAIIVIADIGSVPYAVIFGLNRLDYYALRDPLRRALSLGLIIILFNSLGLLGAMISALIVEGILASLYFYWSKKYFKPYEYTISLSFLRPYLQFGFLFYVCWWLINLWQRAGNILIEYITNDSRQVALFDIANQSFVVLMTTTLFIVASLVPFFTELSLRSDQREIEKWCIAVIKYIGIGCTIIAIVFFVLGGNLIELIFGRKYDGVFENTLVLIFGLFPMAIAQLGYTLSVISKEPQKYFYCIMSSFVIFMFSSLLLIPKYKALGCSMAMSISYTVMAVASCVFFKKKIWLCLPGYILSIALGVIVLPVTLLKDGLMTNIVLIISAVVVYLIVLMSTQILNVNELKAVVKALRPRHGELGG